MTLTPSYLAVLQAAVDSAVGAIHTCMPAEVVRVLEGASKRQFVDVLPCVQRRVWDDEKAANVDESLPVIPSVPVAYPQGGGFFISLPLKKGDIVTLVFAERSLDQWLQIGRKGRGGAIPAGDVGTHTLEGAIALPCGPAPRPELLTGVDASDLVVGSAAGIVVRVKPSGDLVLAEGNKPLALADASGTEFDRIKQDIQTLKAAVSAGLKACMPGNGTPTATTFDSATVAIPSSPASVASTKVRAR